MTRKALIDLLERAGWTLLYSLVSFALWKLDVAESDTLITLGLILQPMLSVLKSGIGSTIGNREDVSFVSKPPTGANDDGLIFDIPEGEDNPWHHGE